MADLIWDFKKLSGMRREKMFKEEIDIGWNEIAEAAGIGLSTMHRYRRNEISDPHFSVVVKLASYFGVTPSHFLADDSDPIPPFGDREAMIPRVMT